MSLNIQHLETSFDLLAPRGDELVEDFYNRAFVALPEIRSLFPADMTAHRRIVLSTLVLVRKSLRDLNRIVPTLHALGARHIEYGAKPEYYPIFGEALIASMAAVAGDDWRPEYGTAWAAAFAVVVDVMIEGAEAAMAEEERAAA